MASEPKRSLDILLVEDNPVNRRLAHLVLEREGHRVTVADNGVTALDVLQRASFDLVLMDVQMPGMDGIEATGAIRGREQNSGEHIPIIALTAHATVHDRERCLRAGMDGYLTKPIQPERLLDAIRHLRDVRPKVPQALQTAKSLLDRSALLEQVGGDVKVLNEIAELFVRDCDKHMASAKEAAKSRDRDRLGYLLHTLRGMFSNLFAYGAQEATGMVQSLLAAGEMEQVEAAFAQLEQQVELFKAELLHMADVVPA